MRIVLEDHRQEVVKAAKFLLAKGLVQGSNGNLSVKIDNMNDGSERYLITPSGVDYENMTGDDLALVNDELEVLEGEAIPSSESYLHRAIYRKRKDIRAIVHTHSPYACVAAAAGVNIPPILDEMVIYTGGAIEVARYGFPGTEELADAAIHSLGDRRAVLLKNHGLCVAGSDMRDAVRLAIMCEQAAQVFVHASALGGAQTLPAESVDTERAIYLMRSGLDNG